MIIIVLVFFAATLLLFVIPFVPGLREVRAKRDAGALPVSAEATTDIRHFAAGFRAFLEREMAEPLERVRETGMRRSGWIEDQGQYYVLPGREAIELFDDEEGRRVIDRIIAGVGDLDVQPGIRCLREMYAGGSFRAGAASEVRAVLAEDDVTLERSSRSVRWVHAGRDFVAREDCVLQGRASAGRSITLAAGCRFERLNAPVIRFGAEGGSPLPRAGDVVGGPEFDTARAEWRPTAVTQHHEMAAGRLLVEGDLDIPARAFVRFDLVVWGRLSIGEGAHLEGSAKGHREVQIARGARIDGSVVGQSDVTLDDGVTVDGPVIAEDRLKMGARCVIGTVDGPSTVRAGAIVVRSSSVIHGTAWASGQGEVTA